MGKNAKFEEAYKKLNTAQRKAVDTIEGPVMVLAGPGTGKTQIAAVRIANILTKTDTSPGSILALTFSDSAAKAMRERLLTLIGNDAYYVQIYTFHGFCSEVIRSNPDSFIIGPDPQPLGDLERFEIIQSILEKNHFKTIKPAGSIYYYTFALIKIIQTLKREGVEQKDFDKLISATELPKLPEVAVVYGLYQLELAARGRFDFEDMINFVNDAFAKEPGLLLNYQEKLQYVLVDEYQDTNSAQNKLVGLLANYWGEAANLFVVGDPNQSIYRFQGASFENILWFLGNYPKAEVIELEDNYRSAQFILDGAYGVIKHNKQEFAIGKGMLVSRIGLPEAKIKLGIFSTELAEDYYVASEIKRLIAGGVEASQIAVIFRNNKDGERLADLCVRLGIGVSLMGGGNILNDQHIRQFINLLRVVSKIQRAEEGSDLFAVLNYPFLEFNPLDNLKLARGAAQSRQAIVETIEKEGGEKHKNFLGKIAEWNQLKGEITLAELMDKIVLESGFLAYLEKLPDSMLKLNRLRALFDNMTAMRQGRPNICMESYLKNIDLMEQNGLAIDEPEMENSINSVKLTTAHRAKGMEWDYCFLYKVEDGKWGNNKVRELLKLPPGILKYEHKEKEESKQERNEDERRLFYVAMTRAKKQLVMTLHAIPSMFVNELPEKLIDKIDPQPVESELQNNLAVIFKSSDKPKQTENEKRFLNNIVKDFSWSASALNTYLLCPYKFKLQNLIKVPETPHPSMLFGSAVHKTLEHIYRVLLEKETRLEIEEIIVYFERELKRLPLTELEFQNRRQQGKEVLTAYFEAHNGQFNKPLFLEKWFGSFSEKLLLNNKIPLIGKVDRIELIDLKEKTVRLIDYKTGSPKTAGQVEGTTADSSGELKRQLTFYKILTDLDKRFGYKVIEAQLDFVESPLRNNRWQKYTLEVSEEDIKKVKEEIEKAAQDVSELKFGRTENYDDCINCPFYDHCWPDGVPIKTEG